MRKIYPSEVNLMVKKIKMVDWRCKTGRSTKLDKNSPFKSQFIGFDCAQHIGGKTVKADMVSISIPKKKRS